MEGDGISGTADGEIGIWMEGGREGRKIPHTPSGVSRYLNWMGPDVGKDTERDGVGLALEYIGFPFRPPFLSFSQLEVVLPALGIPGVRSSQEQLSLLPENWKPLRFECSRELHILC